MVSIGARLTPFATIFALPLPLVIYQASKENSTLGIFTVRNG